MLKNSLEQLNGPQRQAAVIADEHVRIIAGAGSGKTRVLMVRIAYLIEEIGILPWRIMAITFTNKAANEMKERLRAMIGPTADDVRISTIHSLCVRMLREDGMTIGLGGWVAWRTGLGPIFRAWRTSLLAGNMGAAASLAWFTAYAMHNVADVRTLGMIEVVFSYLVSRRVLRENLSRPEQIGIALMLVGLVLICLPLGA